MTRTERIFAEMFAGWDRVDSWLDQASDKWNVRLQIDMLRVHEHREPAMLADALWPRRPHVPPLRGVRFKPGRRRWRLR